ncbi:MAG: hypothetical protein EOP82_17560 [Variovorax sp.]|nr:MAG: hypothetical protein EOP82_17560 [Variovorax sp.]
MAMVVCPICNTENRDIAKFCIECVNALPTGQAKLAYASTQLLEPAAHLRRPPARRWLGVAAAALVALVITGIGAWYGYTPDQAQSPAVAAPPVAASPVAVVESTPAVVPAAATDPPVESPSPQRAAQAAKPTRPRTAVAAAEPRAACSGLSFIAAARCMAEQCTNPKFKPHTQCEAVRRQQRLEEEKRNPTLAN